MVSAFINIVHFVSGFLFLLVSLILEVLSLLLQLLFVHLFQLCHFFFQIHDLVFIFLLSFSRKRFEKRYFVLCEFYFPSQFADFLSLI